MLSRWPRLASLALVTLLILGLSPLSAGAAPEDTFVTFSGEGGDSITGDLPRSYDRSNAQIITTGAEDNSLVQIQISGDTWWNLNFAGPAGSALEPGVYEGAIRYPFQAPGNPGFSFYGNGRACNTSISSFEVIEAAYGPHGFVERFHAIFEQRCEESTTSRAFGEILIDNGQAPELLMVEVVVDDPVALSKIGRATVTGTAYCSKATNPNIALSLAQRVNRRLTTSGSTFFQIPCTSEGAPFSVQLQPQPAPFNPGQAQLDIAGNAFDTDYGINVTFQSSTTIKLSRAK